MIFNIYQKIMLNISHNSKLLLNLLYRSRKRQLTQKKILPAYLPQWKNSVLPCRNFCIFNADHFCNSGYLQNVNRLRKSTNRQATSLEMSDRSDKIRQSAINSQQQMQEKTASISNILNEKSNLQELLKTFPY